MSIKKCFGCKKYSELPDKRFNCAGDVRTMEIVCLLRHFLWGQQRLTEKTEPLIDEMGKEINEGEEWKNK